ncbi:MAG: glycerol-3-phosphate dehydrogenase/oxidase [Caldilineales bacterium]|nr:glycerol-3-phosphate dehydrogenase/oxidase [Caldilineales bacterium]MDW8318680.1 glycerol-3-phosphate dehydrogenase/oxidase [Anaerolineae bacterium]
MFPKDYRDRTWSQLDDRWDLVIIGGGITGAGILREAVRLGLKALLVEKRDFAWGTSSRSSKLVHGGLRYLREGKLGLTRASVRERDRLLAEGPGLVDPLSFLFTSYKGDHPGRWTMSAGLTIYDLLALQWSHRRYSPEELRLLAPHIGEEGLVAGLQYGDAQTDDARLVLRVIQEAVAGGGAALNYVAAEQLLRNEAGEVIGVRLARADALPGQAEPAPTTREVFARAVVNATGAWADRLRQQVGQPPRIRPLRGSHLIFPAWRLPVAQAITFLHPVDGRPVFIFPWEGVTLVGTTDVDHHEPLDGEPRISPQEVAYLMAAAAHQFPSLRLTLDDVLATYAGVRPVVGTGQADPSKEPRDHVVWQEAGLLTVTGGKLTTFRLIALDALSALRSRLPDLPAVDEDAPILDPLDPGLLPTSLRLSEEAKQRLLGRYGAAAADLVAAAGPDELGPVPGTSTLWAELRWAARSEAVVHLDDLMLRRTRLGLVLAEGGRAFLPRIRAICQPELGWDDRRWQAEEAAYLALWRRCYSLPEPGSVPSWHAMLAEARARRLAEQLRRRGVRREAAMVAAAALLALLLVWLYLIRRNGRARRA